MLKSLRNHRQSQQPTGSNGGLMGADAEKENNLSWSLNRCTSKQMGLEVNTIIGDVRG